MIKELLKDHETVIVHLRKDIDECDEKFGDKGTADFLTDLIKEHETLAWTLRRYLD
jgi:starvation-inducible DNA-binding protein